MTFSKLLKEYELEFHVDINPVKVAHMMRRVRLNMYRAEDEMFIMRKRQVSIVGK